MSWSQPAWLSGCPIGTHCTPPKPHKLVKRTSHWNTLHTTPQTGEAGVPQEDTAHHPNPTNWSSGCPTGRHCTPSKPHKLVKRASHRKTLHCTSSKPHKLVKRMSHWNTLHHHPNPLPLFLRVRTTESLTAVVGKSTAHSMPRPRAFFITPG